MSEVSLQGASISGASSMQLQDWLATGVMLPAHVLAGHNASQILVGCPPTHRSNPHLEASFGAAWRASSSFATD